MTMMIPTEFSYNFSNTETNITTPSCSFLPWSVYLASSVLSFFGGLSITLLLRIIILFKKKREKRIQAQFEEKLKRLSALGGNEDDLQASENHHTQRNVFRQFSLSRVVRSKTLKEGRLIERLAIAFARAQNFCEKLQSGESNSGKIFVWIIVICNTWCQCRSINFSENILLGCTKQVPFGLSCEKLFFCFSTFPIFKGYSYTPIL